MSKFWKFKKLTNKTETENETITETENVLILNGVIAEESWWGDEVTPGLFKNELSNYKGDLTVWINSPGGDLHDGREFEIISILDLDGRREELQIVAIETDRKTAQNYEGDSDGN